MRQGSYLSLGEKINKSKNIIAEFYIESKLPIKKAAEKVAGESSIGTWTKRLCTLKPRIWKDLRAKIFEIKGNYVKIAYPLDLFELGSIPQLLSSIGGNVFGMKAVENLRLMDIDFPDKYIKSFKGPRFGIPGVRKTLKVKKRPLVGTIVKPKMGLNPREHAKYAYEAWVGGLDIVKDDENLTSMKFNPFKKRVVETLKMRNKAEKETGEKKAYMANITAETNEALKRAEFIKKNGGRYAMVDIITLGWASLQTIRDANFGLILHAHRAGHAMFTRNKKHGMSMLVVAKLSRLIGVDQIHIGTIVGKMEGPKQEVINIGEMIEHQLIKKDKKGHVLGERWCGLKPVFAVSSGGLCALHVPPVVRFIGNNVIIQAGGGVSGHRMGVRAGAASMRQAVEATMKGISLKEYAKTHKELKEALDEWGNK